MMDPEHVRALSTLREMTARLQSLREAGDFATIRREDLLFRVGHMERSIRAAFGGIQVG